MRDYDAVLVLGGGVREGGELPSWVITRFDRAIELASVAPIVCLSAGTVHRPPPLSDEGYPILESAAGAAYLVSQGVPPHRVFVELTSYDTIGNAYFSKLLYVDPAGWKKLLVITSEFHMPRSKAIFEWIFGMEPGRYRLSFEATPDEGFPEDLLARRREKEASALAALLPLTERIADLRCFHEWLYSKHAAYTADGWISRKASPPATMDLY